MDNSSETITESIRFESTAKMIFKTGAYRVSAKDPFIYTSRKIGADYIDMGMIQDSPKAWKTIVDLLCDSIEAVVDVKKIDRISGGELRDLVFSIPVSMKLGIPHVIIRKEAKTYGAMGRFVGSIKSGDYIVHVADLMTVGSSSLKWISALREEAGATIDYYFEGFDRLQGGGDSIQKMSPPIKNISLCRRDERFYDLGVKLGFIEDRAELMKFNDDPDEWAKSFLRNNPDFIVNHTAIKDGHIDSKKDEGLEVLLKGYPDLIPDLGPVVSKIFDQKGVVGSIPEIGYRI